LKIECANSVEYSVVADTDGGDLSEERIDNVLRQEKDKIIKGIMIDYLEVDKDMNENIRFKNSNDKEISKNNT